LFIGETFLFKTKYFVAVGVHVVVVAAVVVVVVVEGQTEMYGQMKFIPLNALLLGRDLTG